MFRRRKESLLFFCLGQRCKGCVVGCSVEIRHFPSGGISVAPGRGGIIWPLKTVNLKSSAGEISLLRGRKGEYPHWTLPLNSTLVGSTHNITNQRCILIVRKISLQLTKIPEWSRSCNELSSFCPNIKVF